MSTSGRFDIATSKRFVWRPKPVTINDLATPRNFSLHQAAESAGATPTATQHLPSSKNISTKSRIGGKNGQGASTVQARWTENAVEIEGWFLLFTIHSFHF